MVRRVLSRSSKRTKRVRNIVSKYFDKGDIGIDDDDIIDAAGIGLWFALKKIQGGC